MFPTLITIGPLTFRTYGALVALGMFLALQYMLRRAKQQNLPEENILDMSLYAIVAGLIGGRLAYVLLSFNYFAKHPSEIFMVWEGGMVFYGGLLLGSLAVIYYIKKHPVINLWKLADIVAPALALGHVFGRLGCFFAGCCYGHETSLPWGVTFRNTESLAPLHVCLHPTQLYEALGNLVIFIFLDWYNRYKHGAGKTFWVYLFFYGMLRFHMEFLRGDDRGGMILGMSPGQLMSLALIVTSVAVLAYKKGKHE